MDLVTIAVQILLIGMETGLPLVFMFLGVYLIFRLLDDFDLSVQGTFPMGGATVAVLLARGMNPLAATAFAVLAGCVAGLVTGLIHTRLHVTLLLAGIISMIGLYTINLHIMGGPNVPLLNVPTIFSFADDYGGLEHGIVVSAAMLVLLGLFVGGLIYLLNTELGLAIRATGGNPAMARSMGVNTAGITILCVVLANGLIALSGALVAQDQGYADISMGTGSIVAGIASILLGELIVRKPGRVKRGVVAVVIGTLAYRLLFTLALRLGLEPFDLQLFTAVTLLFALVIPRGVQQVQSQQKQWGRLYQLLGKRPVRMPQEGLSHVAAGRR